MSRTTVWKCDQTGKLFEDKKKYVVHLKKLARVKRYERRIRSCDEQRDAIMLDMGNTVKSMTQLAQFVKDNWTWFFYNGLKHESFSRQKVEDRHELLFLSFDEMTWKNSASNSHVAPRNGVTNWSRKETFPDGTLKPTGYPGWVGTIRMAVRGDQYTYRGKTLCTSGFSSHYFTDTLIKTGSGGGGATEYQFGATLFAADFPAMLEQYEKEKIWNQLAA